MLMPSHNLWKKKTNYVTWLKYGSQGQFSYSISIAYDIYIYICYLLAGGLYGEKL